MVRYWRTAVVLAASGVALAGCGMSSGSGGSGSSGGSASPAAAGPVAVAKTSAGMVLVDAKGDALYSPDQEKSGTIKCGTACAAIWPPVTVDPGTSAPSSVSGASGTFGTVKRADGSTQLTYQGRPLYRFTLDHNPGTVTGNGTRDTFDGTHFTWHVVAASGGAASTSPSTGGGNNGYNY